MLAWNCAGIFIFSAAVKCFFEKIKYTEREK